MLPQAGPNAMPGLSPSSGALVAGAEGMLQDSQLHSSIPHRGPKAAPAPAVDSHSISTQWEGPVLSRESGTSRREAQQGDDDFGAESLPNRGRSVIARMLAREQTEAGRHGPESFHHPVRSCHEGHHAECIAGASGHQHGESSDAGS